LLKIPLKKHKKRYKKVQKGTEKYKKSTEIVKKKPCLLQTALVSVYVNIRISGIGFTVKDRQIYCYGLAGKSKAGEK